MNEADGSSAINEWRLAVAAQIDQLHAASASAAATAAAARALAPTSVAATSPSSSSSSSVAAAMALEGDRTAWPADPVSSH